MKIRSLYIVCSLLVVCFILSCSSTKKASDNKTNSVPPTESVSKKDAPRKGFDSELTKEQKKQKDLLIKEQVKKQKQLEKQAKLEKKRQQKLAKQKQKEEEKLIRNASKDEKKRIEKSREQERLALKNSLKSFDPEDSTQYDMGQLEQPIIEDSILQDQELKDILSQTNNEKAQIDSLNNDTISIANNEDTIKPFIFDSLAPVDKIIYLSQPKSKKHKSKKGKQNIISKTFNEMFPEHIDRDITYDKFYDQAPKNIMILYPYNRSQFDKASQMILVSATKELTSKGYYIPSSLSINELYKKDTSFSAQYVRKKDIRQIGADYGMDAIMFITVYRFDNPYWSSATKAVVHFALLSTKNLDTLFYRNIEFNYDTPLPPKENRDKNLELDEEQRYDLGVMQQLTTYTFADFPKGYRHKGYKTDMKKNSNKKEVKYKINVRPS